MKNLYVYNNKIWEVIDETQTHYVCAPKSITEGYGYIPKIESMSLEDYENRFDLSNLNLEQCSKKVGKILKSNSLTEYEKLRWGEENGAENIEIAILDIDGSIPKDLSQHGCACSSPEGNVNIYYGKENGADDKTITIKTFNEKIKVTNINFI